MGGDNKCEIRRQELQETPSAKQLEPITEQWRTHQFGPLQPDEVQRRLNFAFGSANPTKRSPTYKMTVPAEGHFEYYPNGRSTWVSGAPVEKTFYTEWTIGYHIDQAVNRRTPTLTFTQYQVTTGHTYPLILIPPPQVEASLSTKKIFQDTLSSKITEFINENSCTPTPVIYHACGIKNCGGKERKIPGFPGICDQTFKITITSWKKPHKLGERTWTSPYFMEFSPFPMPDVIYTPSSETRLAGAAGWADKAKDLWTSLPNLPVNNGKILSKFRVVCQTCHIVGYE